jgi:hypothetical protein
MGWSGRGRAPPAKNLARGSKDKGTRHDPEPRKSSQARRLTSPVRFGVTAQRIGNGYSIGCMSKCWEALGKMA